MKFFADFYRVFGIPILWLAHFTKDVLYLLSNSSKFSCIDNTHDVLSYYAIIVKNLAVVKSKKGIL